MKNKFYATLKMVLYCLLAISVVICIRAVVVSFIAASAENDATPALTTMVAYYTLLLYAPLPAAFADMLYCVRYFESDEKNTVKTAANCLFTLLSIAMIESVIREMLSPYSVNGSIFWHIYLVTRGIYMIACRISDRSSSFRGTEDDRVIPAILITAGLNIVTYLLAFLIFPIFDLLGLLFLLLNVIFVPTFFCAYAKRLSESAEVSRKRKTVVILSSVLAMIAADIVVCIIKFQGIMVYYMPAKGVWYLISGVWALLNYHADRPSGNKKAVKVLTSVFAALSLILNAFMFFSFTPWYEAVKYEILLILPFLLAFISISSYLIGKIVSEPHKKTKLIIWLSAIMASVLSLICCVGYLELVILGIPAAVIMFIFCMVGMERKKRNATV